MNENYFERMEEIKNKYLQTLREIQNPIISSGYDLQTWKAKSINLITRIYGDKSKQEKQIDAIEFRSYPSFGVIGGTRSGGGNNGTHCEKQANEMVTSFIADIETFGLPEIKKLEKNNGINISVNQNQTVNVNLIWESVKDELTGKQVKELEEILNDKNNPEIKKKKIIDKIKSFGTDVATNVIAGILTNPAIYGG